MAGPTGSGSCSAAVRSRDTEGAIVSSRNCSRLESKCCVSEVPSKDFWPYSIGCLRGCTVDELSSPSGCKISNRKGFTAGYIPEGGSNGLSGVFNSSGDTDAALVSSTIENTSGLLSTTSASENSGDAGTCKPPMKIIFVHNNRSAIPVSEPLRPNILHL